MHKLISAAIVLLLATFAGQAAAGEFIDYSTQHTISMPVGHLSLHMCAQASFMVGVHVGRNQLLCQDDIKVENFSDLSTNDASTQRQGMAACPPNTAMVGLHAARNVLLCGPIPVTLSPLGGLKMIRDERIDSNTVRRDMHACPPDSLMVGIHVGRNLLLCGLLY